MPVKYEILPHYPSEMIKLASEGRSMVQIAAHWKVPKDQVKAWGTSDHFNNPDFKDAYAIARTCNEGYWEDIGQKGAKGVLMKFNPMAWERLMKARHKDDWVDVNHQKIELNNNVKKMTMQEIDDQLSLLLAQRNLIKSTPPTDGSPATP